MRVNDFAFIGGEEEGYDLPLQNFLPLLPKHVATAWVAENQLAGHYLIDPISANPILPVELAASGCKVLVSRSNPINWLMTEVLCQSGCGESIAAAVNKLLIHRKNDQSLEDLLKTIYLTPCSGCKKMVQAEGFIWEKGIAHPVGRVYSCPYCGDSGERETTDDDLENIRQLGNLEIYQSRAKQRVGVTKEYEEDSIKAALACYLPRALYVCMLLVNRLELLEMDKEMKKFLHAALLTVFNDAHNLRHWPPRDYRFLQFAVPQRSLEVNLYLSLTRAHQKWPQFAPSIPITYWPKLPAENGGVCFFQSRLAEKETLFNDLRHIAVTTIFPRPGQAYWTFSALWAGWLWGRNAVVPLRSALGRRRYDWFWYMKAIYQSMRRVQIKPDAAFRVFGIFPHFTPNLVFGLLMGMECAGLGLRGAAFRHNEELFQAEWVNTPNAIGEKRKIADVIRDSLKGIHEPVDLERIMMLAFVNQSLNRTATRTLREIEENEFTILNNEVKQTTDKGGVLIPTAASTQYGRKYILYERDDAAGPLSEQVEATVRTILQNAVEISRHSIDRMVCRRFMQQLTPEKELVNVVIDAYAEQVAEGIPQVKLRKQEYQAARESDMVEMENLIEKIGKQLGFAISRSKPIAWSNPQTNKTVYDFYITTSTQIANPVLKPALHEDAEHVLIYPGSRAALMHYRMQEDSRFSEAADQHWHFVKFRHVRRLAEDDQLSVASWKALLDRDPPLREPPAQLQII